MRFAIIKRQLTCAAHQPGNHLRDRGDRRRWAGCRLPNKASAHEARFAAVAVSNLDLLALPARTAKAAARHLVRWYSMTPSTPILRLPRSRRRDFLQTIVWRYSLFLTNPRERRRNRADTNGRNTPEGLPVRTGPSACWAAADGARGAGRIRLPGGPDRPPAPERLAADVLLPYLRVRGRSSHDDLDFADLVVERDADPAAHADDHRLAGVESRGQPVIKADAGRIQVWRLWAG